MRAVAAGKGRPIRASAQRELWSWHRVRASAIGGHALEEIWRRLNIAIEQQARRGVGNRLLRRR